MYDKAFFDKVRTTVFGGQLTDLQVAGMNAIGDAWKKFGNSNIQQQAYLLATAFHETAHTMQPIHELGQLAYFDKYEPGTPIGIRLGNTLKGDGFRFRGRGFVQITGRRNYLFAGNKIGVDLVATPDRALEPAIAGQIAVMGSVQGWFTGKSLGAFIDDIDEADTEEVREYLQARRVINGQDRAQLIADEALLFEAALKASSAALARGGE